MHPLSIPTIHDRVMQALFLLAYEPVDEVTADHHSYGFQPKRTTLLKGVLMYKLRKNQPSGS